MSIDNNELKFKLLHWGADYYKRQTGRTTRMFEAAKAMAASGKPVTVLMKDEHSANCWRERGWEVPGLEIINLQVRDTCGNEGRVDWCNLKMLDHRANNVLFIDHDVLYVQFKHVFAAFSEFDNVVSDIPEHIQEATGVTVNKVDSVNQGQADSSEALYEKHLDVLIPIIMDLTPGVPDQVIHSARQSIKDHLMRQYRSISLLGQQATTTSNSFVQRNSDLSAQEEALLRPRLLSVNDFGHLSFSEYEEVVEKMLSTIARTVSIEETDNPALFCYTVGKLKHKLLEDWQRNYGAATAA